MCSVTQLHSSFAGHNTVWMSVYMLKLECLFMFWIKCLFCSFVSLFVFISSFVCLVCRFSLLLTRAQCLLWQHSVLWLLIAVKFTCDMCTRKESRKDHHMLWMHAWSDVWSVHDITVSVSWYPVEWRPRRVCSKQMLVVNLTPCFETMSVIRWNLVTVHSFTSGMGIVQRKNLWN